MLSVSLSGCAWCTEHEPFDLSVSVLLSVYLWSSLLCALPRLTFHVLQINAMIAKAQDQLDPSLREADEKERLPLIRLRVCSVLRGLFIGQKWHSEEQCVTGDLLEDHPACSLQLKHLHELFCNSCQTTVTVVSAHHSMCVAFCLLLDFYPSSSLRSITPESIRRSMCCGSASSSWARWPILMTSSYSGRHVSPQNDVSQLFWAFTVLEH